MERSRSTLQDGICKCNMMRILIQGRDDGNDEEMKYTVDTVAGTDLPIYIGGEWRTPRSGSYLDSFDPANGAPWYRAADGSADDINDAVEAAAAAARNPAWRAMNQTDRGLLVSRLADLIEQNAEALAQVESRDNGKLLREMQAQMAYLPGYYRYFAGMADKIQGDVIPVNKPDILNFTMREPIGVVGVIVPWNSPLYMMSCTVAPSLAVGNCVVIKPSEHTSASAIAFAELVAEAGFPDGVFNVVSGYGHTSGDALTRHSGIGKIAFTGGTETGRKVASNAGQILVPCNLELGGKSPHVVFADADLERASNGLVSGIFAAAGQTCVAGSRCFVQSSIHDEIVDRLKEKAQAIQIGHPRDEATQLGPLALASQLEKVARYIGFGLEDGAQLVTGGAQPKRDDLQGGWYYEPTVFAKADNTMRVARDEIFGPVASVIKFDDEADLIEMANDTAFGLASGIWTRDIDRALRFAKGIDAGTVWINTYRAPSVMTPSGGFKDSGYGKHNGFEAVRELTRLKSVVIDHSGSSHDPFVMKLGGSDK